MARCLSCMHPVEAAVCPHCGYPKNPQNKAHQLPVGTVLRSRYRLGKVLGQGGFGITYLAWDTLMDMQVAVKEFFPGGTVYRDTTQSTWVKCITQDKVPHFEYSKERFLREAKALVQFRDIPEIVNILDFVEDNNTAYIVMEYLHGVDLLHYTCDNGGRLSVKETFRILRPVMEALAKVHKAGIIHRDISPDNILLTSTGNAKLLDFGAVRTVEHPDVAAKLSESTDAILKHGYAPMEQYNRRGSLGPWTDCYAMCATIWFCLTGTVPDDATLRMAEGIDPDWSTIRGLTRQQQNALAKGMRCRPKDRHRNMDSLINALFSDNIPDENEAAHITPRKSRKLFFIAAAAVAAVVAVTVLALTLISPAAPGMDPALLYQDACALMESGQYTQAAEVFEALGDYEDSTWKAESCRMEADYLRAEALMAQEQYAEAADVYETLGEYKDSAKKAVHCRTDADYLRAVELMAGEQYVEAERILTALGDYKDSAAKAEECRLGMLYQEAEAYLEAGDYYHAATGFYAAAGFRDAWDRSIDCWSHFHPVTVIPGQWSYAYIKNDGTVVASYGNEYGQSDVSQWKDIVSISASTFHTVGLKADGTVVAVGNNQYGQCDVSQWRDIVSITTGPYHTIGLKADGTVVAVGSDVYTPGGVFNLSGWQDIVAIITSYDHTVGVKANGTIVAVGIDSRNAILAWQDIVAISSGGSHIVGLKADGTAVAVQTRQFFLHNEIQVSDWQNLVAVCTGASHTVGLKADGTVVAVGYNNYGECNVSHWSDIVAVFAGPSITVGVKANGDLVYAGVESGLSGMADLRIPVAPIP